MKLLKEDDRLLDNENNINNEQNNQNFQDVVDLTQNKQDNNEDKVQDNQPNKDINWTEEYRKATSTSKPLEVMEVIQRFLKTLNFKNYDKNTFDKFVQNNSSSLRLECNKYGLSKDNPFFIFLQKYVDYNGTITPFIDYNKWNILHNCIANGTLEENQLTFKSETKNQIRILVNPNLWNLSPVSDIKFCIELYAELVSIDLDLFIKNGYVKAAFATDNPANNSKNGFSSTLVPAKMNENTNVIGLLKCIFMTNQIEKLDNAKININSETRRLDANGESTIDRVRSEITKIKDDPEHDLVSGELVSVDVIEHQYKILNENVQLSDTALDGTRQKKDTDDVNKYNYTNKDDRAKNKDVNNQKKTPIINTNMQNLIKSGNNYQNLIGSVKNILSLNSNVDIADALTALANLYKKNNKL